MPAGNTPREMRVVELATEDYDSSLAGNGNDGEEEVTHFPMISVIHEDVVGLIRKKVTDSISLQLYLADREIEFLEKYMDRLQNESCRYNNHNDLDEIQQPAMTASDRANALQESENRLNGVHVKRSNFLRRMERANVSLSRAHQIRVLTSPTDANDHYRITNSEWICAINDSMTLQRIKLVCEKIVELREEMHVELSFWSTDIEELMKKLDENQKAVALGMIIEMVSWEAEHSSSRNLLSLMNVLIDSEEAKEQVLANYKQLIVVKSVQTIDEYMVNAKILATLFMKNNLEDRVYREKFGRIICQFFMKVLEHSELKRNHVMSVVDNFQLVAQKMGNILKGYDTMFSLFESKMSMLDISSQHRITEIMRHRHSRSPIPVLPQSGISPGSTTIRHLTVIEHPEPMNPGFENLEAEIERRVRAETARVRNEYEQRIAEEERRRRQEEADRQICQEIHEAERQRLQEVAARRVAESEKQRRREQELEKRAAEVEQRRLLIENEQKKLREEEEQRRALAEAEQRRKKAEEVENQRKLEKQRRKQAIEQYKRDNPCLFMKNINLYLHTDPNETYDEHVLDGKIVGLYFSGHWCPPSRDFTPILKNFYEQVEDDFEIVFISSDNTEQEMNFYLQNFHGNWFHLEHNSIIGHNYSNQLNVNSIPSLVILKPSGQCVASNGRELVQNCQNPRALVNQWKNS